MAQTDDVTFSKKRKLIKKLEEKYSKKAIEDFFGIVIKEVDKEEELYNVYKDGELVFAKIASWDIEDIFQEVAASFVDKMCDESDKEDNLEETERKFAELEAEETENERKHYYVCPICHRFVKRGTHFH